MSSCFYRQLFYRSCSYQFFTLSNSGQGSAAAYSGLGFARHLSGDVDGAIESYHDALSRKPDDPFSSEMLNRALAEAVTYPKSSVFDSDLLASEVSRKTSMIGESILERNVASNNTVNTNM